MKEAGKQAALALKPLIAAASADEKPVFEALAAFFKSGDPAGYLDYLEKWQQTLSPFELIALFEPQGVEDDPSGPASATAGRFQMIAAVEAAAFERALPGNAMFIRPRKDIAPLRAAAYFVAAAPPWSRPVDAAAVTSAPGTLSTSAKGQKTLLFLHAAWAKEKELGEATVRAFSADKETPALRLKWRDSALSAFLILKNVIGYQAGTRKAAADVTRVASPAEGVLKEIHSDLVALYFAFEPISKELGLVPEADCARAMLAEYVSKILEDALADDDIRNLQGRRTIARRAVVRGLLKSGAVSVDRVNDHFFVIIKDFEAARKSVETMLGESQRMISLSLSGEAQSLIDTDGGPLPKTWSASAKQRLASIGARPKTAYLFPSFSATRDKTGRIANVELHNIASLEQWVANQRGNP